VSSGAKLRHVALVALALAPAALWGQRLEYVGGGAGVMLPAGSFGGVDHAGWQLSAQAVARLKGPLAFTIAALYGRTGHKNGVTGSSTLSGATAEGTLFAAGAAAHVRPFVSLGAGAYRVDVSVSGFGSAAATKLALGAGAGLVMGSGGRREYLIARYLSVRTTPQRTSFLAITAGVLVPLGRR
jgi:hypothetical protein